MWVPDQGANLAYKVDPILYTSTQTTGLFQPYTYSDMTGAGLGLVTNPPRDVPFLRAFFDKAVAMMLAQGGGKLRIPVPTAGLNPAAPDAAGGENAESPTPPV